MPNPDQQLLPDQEYSPQDPDLDPDPIFVTDIWFLIDKIDCPTIIKKELFISMKKIYNVSVDFLIRSGSRAAHF
jgi:hypothetical protein